MPMQYWVSAPIGDKAKVRPSGRVVGYIDLGDTSVVAGWVVSIEKDIQPILFINGRPAELLAWPLPRRDVNKALGVPGDLGFQFSAEGMRAGDIVDLYVFDGREIEFVCSRVADRSCGGNNIFSQILDAKEVSQMPDCVAIACWDGAHNPLGRAHVLYQVMEMRRPVVLVSFLFNEFGGKIWSPLAGTDFKRLMIPWHKRHEVYEMMRSVGLSFPTVWMCKPRLPTFELTANLIDHNTRLILDHDDNEIHFAEQDLEDKVYGLRSVSLAKHLQSKITAHTAASSPIARELNASLVRHARKVARTVEAKAGSDEVIKVGFVGTVRPHKGVVEAARAIKLASWILKRDIEFHVYGIFQPNTLIDELTELGVVIKNDIPECRLQEYLSGFDVILTGFPTQSEEGSSITRYQISSKIGDALAVGRPALVPLGESVADLQDCPGVFLFTSENFSETLLSAIDCEETVGLPAPFTLEGAYGAFLEAQPAASKPPRKMFALRDSSPARCREAVPTLLLLWKQGDSGLYGRRVDQVARAYKSRHPNHRVVVLEFCDEHALHYSEKNSAGFSHEARMIFPLMDRKLRRDYTDRFGVEYHALRFFEGAGAKDALTSYLISESILPSNSKMVLFPLVPHADRIYDILSSFRTVVDIVDNQFAWASSRSRLGMGAQYLALARMADRIVLNSRENLKFFESNGFLSSAWRPEGTATVIPNWYAGEVREPHRRAEGEGCDLVYSGNMNDRVDWDLLKEVSELDPAVTVHLVGSASRVGQQLTDLAARDNVVYWGPMLEHNVADLLLDARAGLMPHVTDKVSTFMNPLKVQMYRAHGVPVISTAVPGIDPEEVLYCRDRTEFLETVSRVIAVSRTRSESEDLISSARRKADRAIDEYMAVITSLDLVR